MRRAGDGYKCEQRGGVRSGMLRRCDMRNMAVLPVALWVPSRPAGTVQLGPLRGIGWRPACRLRLGRTVGCTDTASLAPTATSRHQGRRRDGRRLGPHGSRRWPGCGGCNCHPGRHCPGGFGVVEAASAPIRPSRRAVYASCTVGSQRRSHLAWGSVDAVFPDRARREPAAQPADTPHHQPPAHPRPCPAHCRQVRGAAKERRDVHLLRLHMEQRWHCSSHWRLQPAVPGTAGQAAPAAAGAHPQPAQPSDDSSTPSDHHHPGQDAAAPGGSEAS